MLVAKITGEAIILTLVFQVVCCALPLGLLVMLGSMVILERRNSCLPDQKKPVPREDIPAAPDGN